MFYSLAPGLGLRSWQDNPCGAFWKDESHARTLRPEVFELLQKCDGRHALEDSPLLRALELLGMVSPSERPAPIAPWQALRVCDNLCYPAVNWAITQRCNLNCRHCFSAMDEQPSAQEFTLCQCRDLLQQLEACGVWRVSLTGGEPLLHPQFELLLEEIARGPFCLFEIATNGLLITPALLEKMQALSMRPLMKISFDGVGHHDYLRGRAGVEGPTLEAIRLCVEKGFPVRAQVNIHRENAASIPETLERLDAMNVAQIRVIRTSESPRVARLKRDFCLSPDEYYEAMYRLLAQYLQKPRHAQLTTWQFVETDPIRRAYHLRPVKYCRPLSDADGALPACMTCRQMISISGDGEALPCNQMEGLFKYHGISLGNLHTQKLHQLLQSGPYRSISAMSIESVRSNPQNPCGQCDWFSLCAGGCRTLALACIGDVKGYDPLKCAFFRGGYLQRLQDLFAAAGWTCADTLP